MTPNNYYVNIILTKQGGASLDIFLVDTSALLRDIDILNKLPYCKIIIHTTVLEELDNISKKNNSKGSSARRVINKLFELKNRGNFYNGIKWTNKTVEFSDMKPNIETYLRFGLSERKNDNLLLCVAKEIKERSEKNKVIILTADKSFALKAAGDINVEYIKTPTKKKKHKNKGFFNNSQMAR